MRTNTLRNAAACGSAAALLIALGPGATGQASATDHDPFGLARDASTARPQGSGFPPSHGLLWRSPSTKDETFKAGTANQGWWSATLDNWNGNTNYVVGVAEGTEVRNFFTFSLSSVRTRVIFAKLVVSARTRDGDALRGDPVETLGLFDVSTPAEQLNRNRGADQDIFTDLGSGTSYGTFDVDTLASPKVLSFRLNQKAIQDINRHRGQYFSIGGRLLSVEPDSGEQYLFGHTNENQSARLVMKVAPGGR